MAFIAAAVELWGVVEELYGLQWTVEFRAEGGGGAGTSLA